MNTPLPELHRRISEELASLAGTWDSAELAMLLTVLTLIRENRRELAERPTGRMLNLVRSTTLAKG